MLEVMLGLVPVSRNRGEEAIRQDVEHVGSISVETVSRILNANRAAVPEPPEREAVDEIEVDHGVVGAIDDGHLDFLLGDRFLPV